MKKILNAIQRTWLQFRIFVIDRRYLQLNENIAWYEQELIDSKQMAMESRLELLMQRSELRKQFCKLEAN